MVETTSIKVERPVVDWLNSIKGLLEWKHGKKYSLNDALITILAEYDIRYAIAEKLLNPLNDKKVNEYIKKRFKQFWIDSEPPERHWGRRNEFFRIKK